LRPYFEEQLHKAIATYTEKYKIKLDASGATGGLSQPRGLRRAHHGHARTGALGVTFGDVVAMDSPSGRTPGEFNWGATLWHEMSHVFILSATNYRVPRWFTEGSPCTKKGQANPRVGEPSDARVVVTAIKVRQEILLPRQTHRGRSYCQG
jgi:hypothetical protein